MNQKKNLIKNTIIIAIGKLSTQVISFLLLPLYTHQLSTSEYGTYDFLVTLSVFLLPIITLLMEESMFRFLIDADKKADKKKIITQTILYTIIGSILFTIIAFIVVSVIHYELGILFIVFVLSNILIGLSNALSRGLGEIKLYSLSNFILGAFTIVLNIIFIVFIKAGVTGLLFANIISNTLTALYIFKKLHLGNFINRKSYDPSLLKEMISYSIPLVPNNLSWIIINLSDRIIVTSFLGADSNGIYSIANRFPNILYTCYGFFSTAWKESSARILKDGENIAKHYNSIYKDLKKFLFAIVICLIAIMPFAFPILISSSFNESYAYIPLLIISTYYCNISNFYGGIFTAFKNTKIMGNTTIFAAVLNIIINISLIQFIGIYAAVLSTFLSNIIIYFYRQKALKKYVKLRESKRLIPFIVLCIVTGCYYSKNIILEIVSLIIAILYSLIINYYFIVGIKDKIKNKFFRR